jgi:hypothetical protein
MEICVWAVTHCLVFYQNCILCCFYFTVILSTHFFISGTIVKPVGMERQQPIKKSLNHILKKPTLQPKRKSKMPKLITAVIVTETNNTLSMAPCLFDNFIV